MPTYPDIAINLSSQTYTWKDLQPYFLGKGTERWCFHHPQDKKRVIKISFKTHAQQTKREINYFSFLKKRRIPFTHIPGYYGKLEGKNYTGLLQAFIQNYDGSSPELFTDYIKKDPAQAKKLAGELFAYLYKHNILPCDLTADNMVIVSETPARRKFMLIDGLGCTDFIPLAQYSKFLGRMKIKRKFRKMFLSEPFKTLFDNAEAVEIWLKRYAAFKL